MKKFLLTVFAALTASFAMAGDGTKGNPMTVADVLAAEMNEAWVYVEAYIVGSCTGSTISTAEFGVSSNSSNTNIILADTQDETSTDKVVPVQLPNSGSIRQDLALKNAPGNLGKTVLVYGQLIKYFGVNGIKNITTEYELSGDGVTPPTPAGDNFEAALTDGQGNWTFEDEVLPEGLNYIWSQDSQYGMKASGYVSGTSYVTNSCLVSPAIVLQENSVLTFDHVHNKGGENAASQLTLSIREANSTSSEVTPLTIPNYSTGSDWTFVSSGEIDLSAYAGKTIKLMFRYTSDEESAATWEIKNVKVTNAKAADEGPVLKDPTNTPETAYSVSKALEIINNKDDYDMTKKVYVAGTISEITEVSTSYGNATYDITDGAATIKVYRGYFLNGDKFTAEDQIKVGDEVVVYGALTLYNTTPEINTGNHIYSINEGTATGIHGTENDAKAAVIYDLAGRRVEKAAKGLYIVNGKKVVLK